MNFNLKEMYRYLISHTLPGFLLLIEIFMFLKSLGNFNVPDAILKNGFVLVLTGYAAATLLGTMIDGIRHFIFDLLVDSCSKDWWCKSISGGYWGISKFIYDKFSKLRSDNRKINERNFEVFKKYSQPKDNCLDVYKHFIEFSEEAIWYPYEAYANIVVALLLGLILLYSTHLYWQFWALYVIFLISLSFEAVLIYKFCEDDQETFNKIFEI